MRSQERNYPLNCWWVAARSKEISREPVQRWLLDTPVALYRRESGEPLALYDRCPHRWAPLSAGYLEGDKIVCPYHGARFGVDGRCSSFPMQKAVPRSMRVRSFSVVERGPFIWIWMGDDDVREKTALPPEFEWRNNSGWTLTSGNYDFDANYMLLHENVLDLTHFNYLHAKSFKFQNWKPAPTYKAEGNRVQSLNSMAAEDFNDVERALIGLAHPDASYVVSNSWYETPAWHSNISSVYSRSNPELVLSESQIHHLVTPASPTSTHYWWYVGMSVPMNETEAQQFGALIEMGFREDQVMLQSIQDLINRDAHGKDYVELSFQSDGSAVLARRALDRIMAAEKSPDGSQTQQPSAPEAKQSRKFGFSEVVPYL
jgi:phenylpropionate dioxygenase-like ring-hydroxylating dioxygenase large terminal subunit